jgi:hypothetical protein
MFFLLKFNDNDCLLEWHWSINDPRLHSHTHEESRVGIDEDKITMMEFVTEFIWNIHFIYCFSSKQTIEAYKTHFHQCSLCSRKWDEMWTLLFLSWTELLSIGETCGRNESFRWSFLLVPCIFFCLKNASCFHSIIIDIIVVFMKKKVSMLFFCFLSRSNHVENNSIVRISHPIYPIWLLQRCQANLCNRKRLF